MMTGARVAVIGLGHAARHHAAAIQKTNGLELCMVGGRSLEHVKAFCSGLAGAPRPVLIEDVLDAPDIDAVVIAVPPAAQPDLAIAAFDAGKHVLCEKPIAAHPQDAVRIESACNRSGRVGMVNFCYRLIPEVQEFKRLLASGVCGEIGLLQADWMLGTRLQPELTANWKAYAETGGGVLSSYGVHVFDYLFHDREKVDVVGARIGSLYPTRLDEQGVSRPVSGEERAAVMLDVGYPVVVNLSLITAPPTGQRVIAYGSRGTLQLVNSPRHSPGGPFSISCDGLADARSSQHVLAAESPPAHDLPSLFSRTARLFAHAIKSGSREGAPNITDGVKAARLVARIKEYAGQH